MIRILDWYKDLLLPRKSQHQATSKTDLQGMEYFVNLLTSIGSRLNGIFQRDPSSNTLEEVNSAKTRLKKLTNFLVNSNNAASQLRTNLQRVDDSILEMNRFHRVADLYEVMMLDIYKANRGNVEVRRLCATIEVILYGCRRYDAEQEEKVKRLFEELQTAMKSQQALTQEDKRMIHLAMSKDFFGGASSQGHWFTCTNGHYYCITECGGAMERSRCPECKEEIGGQNHRYVSTARLASDMDGAHRPAWSSGYNMRNYQF